MVGAALGPAAAQPPSLRPGRMKGPEEVDFAGEHIHFVQVGLGTNATFVQNLGGHPKDWNSNIDWLRTAMSERNPNHTRGIAVEMVAELAAKHREAALRLPHVDLVVAAIGSEDIQRTMEVLTQKNRDEMLSNVSQDLQESLNKDLEYVANMSCIQDSNPQTDRGAHPLMPEMREKILHKFGTELLMDNQQVNVWTWKRLVEECNFSTCDVLLIDTEGEDTKILESLTEYANGGGGVGSRPWAWPKLIQFETMGHGDQRYGRGTEWQAVLNLQAHGYELLFYSNHDTCLVRAEELCSNTPVAALVSTFKCRLCGRDWQLPYLTEDGNMCRRCSHWNPARWTSTTKSWWCYKSYTWRSS